MILKKEIYCSLFVFVRDLLCFNFEMFQFKTKNNKEHFFIFLSRFIKQLTER